MWLGKRMMVTKDSVLYIKYKVELRALQLRITANLDVQIAKMEESMVDKLEVDPALFYSYASNFGNDSGKTGLQRKMESLLMYL